MCKAMERKDAKKDAKAYTSAFQDVTVRLLTLTRKHPRYLELLFNGSGPGLPIATKEDEDAMLANPTQLKVRVALCSTTPHLVSRCRRAVSMVFKTDYRKSRKWDDGVPESVKAAFLAALFPDGHYPTELNAAIKSAFSEHHTDLDFRDALLLMSLDQDKMMAAGMKAKGE